MALKAIYEKQDDIPEEYRSLFTERGGKWELTGIEGIKTQADIDRVQVGLTKERDDHKVTKDKLALWGDLDHAETQAKLDKIPELEAAAEGSIDEEKMGGLVDARLATLRAPLDREIKTLKEANETQATSITGFEAKDTKRTIHDAVRKQAGTMKVLDVAIEDALLYAEGVMEIRADDGAVVTRENAGVAAGLNPEQWLTERQTTSPHWWAPSQGGGAGGGGDGGAGMGNNPFTDKHWNLTEQGNIFSEKGVERATQLAIQAGTTVGGPRPAPTPPA